MTEPKQESPSKAAAERLILMAGDIPSAPPVAFKLMTLLKKRDQHNEDIVEIIRYDENLTAKLLKLCNSAFFRTGTAVTSVEQVVLKLGYGNIASIAVSLNVGDVMAKNKKASYINPYELWRHSLAASMIAKEIAIAARKSPVDPDTAFTAGLLHEIGKVVLNSVDPILTNKIKELVESRSISAVEAEREVLGTDYAEIGVVLLEKWALPEEILEAVKYHIWPESGAPALSQVCHIATLASSVHCGLCAFEDIIEYIAPGALEDLGLFSEDIESSLASIKERSLNVETFMMVA